MTRLTDDFPIPAGLWKRLISRFSFSPQQARIVELILRNQCDKQIAAALDLKVTTVRTYLERVFHRLGVNSRIGLVLKLLAECLRDAK